MLKFKGQLQYKHTQKNKNGFIYVIKKDDYLYVGETERFSPIRLQEHLKNQNGTFRKNLRSKDPEVDDDDMLKVFYWSVSIDSFNNNDVKTYTNKELLHIIEGDLQLKFQKSCSHLVFKYEVISNIEKTYPKKGKKLNKIHSFLWYKNEINQLFEECCVFFNASCDTV